MNNMRVEGVMAKRKKYFKTRKEAKDYLKKAYEQKTILDPKRDELGIFPLKGKFFLGSSFEYEIARYS